MLPHAPFFYPILRAAIAIEGHVYVYDMCMTCALPLVWRPLLPGTQTAVEGRGLRIMLNGKKACISQLYIFLT